MMSVLRLVVLVIGLFATCLAHAAVDCTVREPDVKHVCASGPLAGQVCDPDVSNLEDPLMCSTSRPAVNDSCQGAKCTIDLAKDAKFSGTMTLIVDENVSQVSDDQTSNGVAVTVLLDLGKDRLLTQTYQTLADPTVAPSDTFGVTLGEQTLRNQALLRPDGKAAALNDLLYRPQDTELAAALRALFSATGTPVITKVSKVTLSDRPDGLGTVLRVKIKGGFVQP
jgi:hypothetical protein